MATHKFKIGQMVFLSPSLGHNIPGGTYIITKRLPEQYSTMSVFFTLRSRKIMVQ